MLYNAECDCHTWHSWRNLFANPSLVLVCICLHYGSLFLLPPNFRIFVWLNKSQILAAAAAAAEALVRVQKYQQQKLLELLILKTICMCVFFSFVVCLALFLTFPCEKIATVNFNLDFVRLPNLHFLSSSSIFRHKCSNIEQSNLLLSMNMTFLRITSLHAAISNFAVNKTINEVKEKKRGRQDEIACEFIVSPQNDRTYTNINTHAQAPHIFNHWQRFEYLLFWQSQQLISA